MILASKIFLHAASTAEQPADAIHKWKETYRALKEHKGSLVSREAIAIIDRHNAACDALLNHLDAHPAQPGSPVPPGPSQQPQSSAAAQDRGES